jgi:hypothetical protein
MMATSMLAKNDIHLRFERQMFDMLFTTYRRTIISNEHCEERDFGNVGYHQISGLLKMREEYDKVMAMGEKFSQSTAMPSVPVTLTEVLAIRQYLNVYLLTLAVRDYKNDRTLRLSGGEATISRESQ